MCLQRRGISRRLHAVTSCRLFVRNDTFLPDRDNRRLTAFPPAPPGSASAACGRTLRSGRVDVVTGSLTNDVTSRCKRSAVVPTSCRLRKDGQRFCSAHILSPVLSQPDRVCSAQQRLLDVNQKRDVLFFFMCKTKAFF